jgi:hypothetical protein
MAYGGSRYDGLGASYIETVSPTAIATVFAMGLRLVANSEHLASTDAILAYIAPLAAHDRSLCQLAQFASLRNH